MRGRIGMLMNHRSTPIIGRPTKLVSCYSSSSSSSSGGDGGGRGRGRGNGAFNSPLYNFVGEKRESNDDDSNDQACGRGRGRGAPIEQAGNEWKRPIFLRKDESSGAVASESRRPIGVSDLPDTLLDVLPGGGRGHPLRKPTPSHPQENRHLRAPPPPPKPHKVGNASPAAPSPKLSREDATKKAVGILSKGDAASAASSRRPRGSKPKDDSDDEDDDDDIDDAAFLGDDADGEKFAAKLGPSLMADVTEAFEDMSFDVLPDLKFDELIEAVDATLKIEFEPEYLMGDVETNPVIDEKPPIPLADALEKMKPFLMACEGLKTQEEWEEAVKTTMDDVPLMKEIVDHYCGPDRVTAKQQHEELERVAKTIPPNVPNSVKRFTDRAVLSLQSNPGWGFHRKWQFMDKLVDEVSKSQK